MLPQPVGDLRAERTGDTVLLRWTMPGRTTDRVTLKGPQRAVFCRIQTRGICVPAGSVSLAPGTDALYSDVLPPDLRVGEPRALRYEVRLENRSGADAGPSNVALTAAGAAPPTAEDVKAEPTREGIVVQWRTTSDLNPLAGSTLLVRLRRERVLRAGENARSSEAEQNAGAQPDDRTLEAKEHVEGGAWTPDRITDAEAALNRSYRYHVQLAERVPLDGRLIEINGVAAQTGVIAADDHFPPAIPAHLAAVADPEGGTVDLSWSADSEPNLRGYFVYRREAGSADLPERVSGLSAVPLAGWSDRTARKGTRYAYSVSAVDATGNESGRSPESVETLP